MILRIALLILCTSTAVNAKHIHPEKFYQNIWCKEQKGISEYQLIDNTRVDCLTKTHAVEFDFASKWAEAIGQSLHYARMTGKNAGIVLIIEQNDDYKHYAKIKPLCEKYNISLWEMKPPKTTPQNTTKLYNINDVIEFIINLIKELIKLFSNF
ncbi:hypothetical protein IJX73_02010 [bacterium]|nr:hypothetical protein [bacterium]MBQ9149683.1 hypothetical protein [bacterium]